MNSSDADRPIGVPAEDRTVDLSPARCVVLVPSQGRIVKQCETALQELSRRGYIVRRVEGYSAIDQARNQMGSDALNDGFQETLWIDSDIGFQPDDVEKLRQHGLPLSCGIYPKKGQRELAIHILPGTPTMRLGISGGLHEVLYCGTGFLHVRRSVYETMISTLNLSVCNEHANRPMWPFFQPLVRSAPWHSRRAAIADGGPAGHWYLGEDFAFCHRARQCEIPIIADTTIRLWHIGDYAYSWEEAGIDRQRFGDFHFQFTE